MSGMVDELRDARWERDYALRKAAALKNALREITQAIDEAQELCTHRVQSCSSHHSFALGQIASLAEKALGEEVG